MCILTIPPGGCNRQQETENMPCAAPLASLRRLPQGTLSVRLLVLLCCSCVSSADLPDDSQPPGAAHQSELELGGRRLPFIVYERGVPTVYRQVERSLLPCNLVFIKVTKCASSTTGARPQSTERWVSDQQQHKTPRAHLRWRAHQHGHPRGC